MKKEISNSNYWDDEFDRKQKRNSIKKNAEYKRKNKYKRDYLDEEY